MKITVVPAQVTTVEDRIIGSLSFSQMMLVIAPVFLGAGLFAVLPPVMSVSNYKYVLMGVLLSSGAVLAIRVKDKILALWLIQIIRYLLRPKVYVFNKNTASHREVHGTLPAAIQDADETVTAERRPATPVLSLPDAVKVYTALDNPERHLRFETNKKGGLYVHLTEIED